MTTIREEMWVKKHFLRPVFYHDFPENMMKTRFQTQSSVVGSARRATTLSSASLRWNARRLDQDDHGDHLHCHQCGVGEVRNMSSPTECQEAPQLHLDYSNPWFVMIDNWIIDAVQWNNIKSRALGALFFAVIGLLMTAVAVAVLWRFWETPVSSASQFPICFISLTSHLILYVSFQDQLYLTLYRLCARVAGNSPASSSSAPSFHSVLRGEEKVLFTHF